MNSECTEPRDPLRRAACGQSLVAVAACTSCGSALPRLAFEVSDTIAGGSPLAGALRETGLKLSALFGYLFPDFSMLLGAWAGASVDGSEGAAALGAVGGFVTALAIVRQLLRRFPGLLPERRQSRRDTDFHVSQQEFHHER